MWKIARDRSVKVGLEYFSHDVDMFQDIKIKFLKAKHGILGYAVFIRLLEEIYSNKGYYMVLDDDFNVLFCDENKLDYKEYLLILDVCTEKGLFDKDLYEKYKILTSRRIQLNYLAGTERRKEVAIFENYLLVDATQKNNVNILNLNDDISKQSKVKKNKEKESKESKEKESKENNKGNNENLEEIINDFTDNEKVKIAMWEFINHRSSLKKNITLLALTKILNKLNSWRYNDNEIIECINNSIMNGWQGVFPLKINNIGNKKPEFGAYEQRDDMNFDGIQKKALEKQLNN